MIAATEVSCVEGTAAPLEGIKERQVWRDALLFAGAEIFILTSGWATERAPNFSAETNFLITS